jgi:DNA polymerase III subunit epsilon
LDAELLAQLYIELTGGKQIGLGFGDDSNADPETNEVLNAIRQIDRPFREPRAHQPLPAEQERHRAFIATIKDAIWGHTT